MDFNKNEILDKIKIECEQIVNYYLALKESTPETAIKPKVFGRSIGNIKLIDKFMKEGIQEMTDKANEILAQLPSQQSQAITGEAIAVIQAYTLSTPTKLI